MKVNKEQLLKALAQVKPGLSNNEMLEQSTHFCFSPNSIRTYNDQISVTYKIDTGISGTIPATKFYQLIQKLPERDLEIEMKEGNVMIQSGRSSSHILTQEQINIPVIDPDQIKGWSPLPEDFCESLSFCSFSASRDMTRPSFTCIHIKGDTTESFDNFRGTIKKLSGKINDDFLLPATVANELIKYSPIKYAVMDNWIHFINEEGTLFSSRTVDDVFPEILPLFEFDGVSISLSDKVQEIVDRIQVLATAEFEQDRVIKMTINKGKLTCRGEGDLGWIQEYTKVDYKGDIIEISIHPTFLYQILKYSTDIMIGDGRALFEGKQFKHVMQLLGA